MHPPPGNRIPPHLREAILRYLGERRNRSLVSTSEAIEIVGRQFPAMARQDLTEAIAETAIDAGSTSVSMGMARAVSLGGPIRGPTVFVAIWQNVEAHKFVSGDFRLIEIIGIFQGNATYLRSNVTEDLSLHETARIMGAKKRPRKMRGRRAMTSGFARWPYRDVRCGPSRSDRRRHGGR